MKKNKFLGGWLTPIIVSLIAFILFSVSPLQAALYTNPTIQLTDTLVTGASYSALGRDTKIKFTGTGAARTLNLFAVNTITTKGQLLYIQAPSDADTYNLTIDASGSELIGTATTLVCSRPNGVTLLENNGTSWDVLNDGSGILPYTGKITGYTQTLIASELYSADNTVDWYIGPFPRAATVTGIKIIPKSSVTQAAGDYWSFSCINTTGSVALLATADSNTTKTSTGAALTLGTARSLTLHGTAANLNVAAGDVAKCTATDAGGSSNATTISLPSFAINYIDR